MKTRSLVLLMSGEVLAMSLWFLSAAILPDMLREVSMSPVRQAALSSGVQAGFVVGALVSAVLGIADRFDPRRVFAISAICAALANAVLLVSEPGSAVSIAARFLTGALLAGVYPVGMKIAIGWGVKDRGFLVGLLVGALTMGTALPHLISLGGGADWRLAVGVASIGAVVGGVLCLLAQVGPHHGVATKFDPRAIAMAWTNRRVRLAYAGYLGHMWELYAMWAWIAAITAASYSASMAALDAEYYSKVTAFIAIGMGSITGILAGLSADRVGKAKVALLSMAFSGSAAIAVAATFGGPVWLTFIVVVIWGATVIPDSAQFSALVADASPPELAGSLMTFQTALGFTLTFITVQMAPLLAASYGWPFVIVCLAAGPAFGIVAMARLKAMD